MNNHTTIREKNQPFIRHRCVFFAGKPPQAFSFFRKTKERLHLQAPIPDTAAKHVYLSTN
ncbi:hypothetical protein [Anaeromassilibacillus senegalensis]|uniref:Uncharacterized protein n=1 Tax=Anaeromassilibacillus senegalensis TaxID=1673717 RepID=A0ABS9CJB8_9FIRM|nr:hypothetical protein [Anaeromassilibacillus senegalensis]MCF2651251.1 hypothetical protein [Anaeromassilibacillus senegalensis]